MARSSASKGAYYKSKTRRWLQQQGFEVFEMEMVKWIHTKEGERIPVKRDQLGADLGAMSSSDLIMIQVKGGGTGGGNFLPARRRFGEFRYPPFVKRWVVAWPARAREPRVIDCSDDIPAPHPQPKHQSGRIITADLF